MVLAHFRHTTGGASDVCSQFLFRYKLKISFRRLNNTFFSALTNFLFNNLFRLKRAEECLPGLKVPMCGEFRLKRAKGCLSGLKAPTCSSFFWLQLHPWPIIPTSILFSTLTNRCHNLSVSMHQNYTLPKSFNTNLLHHSVSELLLLSM